MSEIAESVFARGNAKPPMRSKATEPATAPAKPATTARPISRGCPSPMAKARPAAAPNGPQMMPWRSMPMTRSLLGCSDRISIENGNKPSAPPAPSIPPSTAPNRPPATHADADRRARPPAIPRQPARQTPSTPKANAAVRVTTRWVSRVHLRPRRPKEIEFDRVGGNQLGGRLADPKGGEASDDPTDRDQHAHAAKPMSHAHARYSADRGRLPRELTVRFHVRPVRSHSSPLILCAGIGFHSSLR